MFRLSHAQDRTDGRVRQTLKAGLPKEAGRLWFSPTWFLLLASAILVGGVAALVLAFVELASENSSLGTVAFYGATGALAIASAFIALRMRQLVRRRAQIERGDRILS